MHKELTVFSKCLSFQPTAVTVWLILQVVCVCMCVCLTFGGKRLNGWSSFLNFFLRKVYDGVFTLLKSTAEQGSHRGMVVATDT